MLLLHINFKLFSTKCDHLINNHTNTFKMHCHMNDGGHCHAGDGVGLTCHGGGCDG